MLVALGSPETAWQPGQFYGVHVIASDSKGNIYTTETYEGHRVQRFVYKGLAPVTKKSRRLARLEVSGIKRYSAPLTVTMNMLTGSVLSLRHE
jgi:hypothetical protein